MTRSNFDYELEQLNTELIKMGAAVEDSITSSITAFKNRDYALAKKVMENDRVINDMKRNIESKCLSLILRQQPVAKDLRTVTAALKIVTDMERIGDHAGDISEIVLRLKDENSFNTVMHIPKLAELARYMVSNALSAYINRDTEFAKKIIKIDDETDSLFGKVVLEISQILKTSSEEDLQSINSAIDLLMIAKYFEKIGDHAENICDRVQFKCTGEYKNARMI